MRKNGLKSRPLPQRSSHVYQPRLHPTTPDDTEDGIAWGKWIFLFVAGGWLFFLGAYVGRITVPVYVDENPVEKTLTALQQIEQKENPEAVKKTPSNADLDFYDNLRSQKPVAPMPSSPEPSPEKQAGGQPEVKRPLSSKKSFQAVSRTDEAQKAASASSPSPPLSSSDSPSPSHIYAIQVASFALEKDANQMAARLKRKGYGGAYVTDDNIPGIGVRYRVKVGYFKTQSDARIPLEKLRLKERLPDAYIFKRK